MGILSRVTDDLIPPNSPHEQIFELCSKAQVAFNWCHLDEALALGTRALESLPSAPPWLGGEVLHHVHQLLGLLDLKKDDRPAAKEHLHASARIESTPCLSSFGPSMQLAGALLQLGEVEAVLDYFSACQRFWDSGESRLNEWSQQVREGKMPDFGFNRTFLSLKVPLCWELRRPEAVLGRLYHRTREGAWFVCAFEPAAGFKNIVESVRYDFRNVSGETPDAEAAYDVLKALDLALYPGDGREPVTDAVIQVEGDIAYFRY